MPSPRRFSFTARPRTELWNRRDVAASIAFLVVISILLLLIVLFP